MHCIDISCLLSFNDSKYWSSVYFEALLSDAHISFSFLSHGFVIYLTPIICETAKIIIMTISQESYCIEHMYLQLQLRWPWEEVVGWYKGSSTSGERRQKYRKTICNREQICKAVSIMMIPCCMLHTQQLLYS